MHSILSTSFSSRNGFQSPSWFPVRQDSMGDSWHCYFPKYFCNLLESNLAFGICYLQSRRDCQMLNFVFLISRIVPQLLCLYYYSTLLSGHTLYNNSNTGIRHLSVKEKMMHILGLWLSISSVHLLYTNYIYMA